MFEAWPSAEATLRHNDPIALLARYDGRFVGAHAPAGWASAAPKPGSPVSRWKFYAKPGPCHLQHLVGQPCPQRVWKKGRRWPVKFMDVRDLAAQAEPNH
jgi:hypothetical protein